MKPLFITLEGADCAGKASQSKLLADAIGATLFSSPDYTTPSGILLKKHLYEEWAAASLDKSVQIGCDGKHHGRGTADCPRELHHHHDDRCLPIYRALPTQDNMIVRQALMVLNRLEMQVKVEEALKSGPVVADRWHDSAIVYGSVEGVPVPEGFLQPDLRILLDMDVATAQERLRLRGKPDANEKDLEKQQRVIASYLGRWHREMGVTRRLDRPPWWTIVDGRKSIKEVAADVMAHFQAICPR